MKLLSIVHGIQTKLSRTTSVEFKITRGITSPSKKQHGHSSVSSMLVVQITGAINLSDLTIG